MVAVKIGKRWCHWPVSSSVMMAVEMDRVTPHVNDAAPTSAYPAGAATTLGTWRGKGGEGGSEKWGDVCQMTSHMKTLMGSDDGKREAHATGSPTSQFVISAATRP